MQTVQVPPQAIPPTGPSQWSLSEIQAALSRPLPASLTSTRTQGNTTVEYIQWHTVNKILDKYAPGWCWEICRMGMSSDRIFLVGRLTIPTSDGDVCREATGNELLSCEYYSDPSSNAESMAFRRAAARFGLGLYLYNKS